MNSLINPSVSELLKQVDNRYGLVTVAAKRARQLVAGQEPLIDSESIKPLSIAVQEVQKGLITFETLKDGVK